MEYDRCDPYLEAVAGCFKVHYNIAKSLRQSESAGKEADLKIREEIYVDIVENLERALDQSTSQSSKKRSRHEVSPSRQEDAARKPLEYSTVSTRHTVDLPSPLNPDLGRATLPKRHRKSAVFKPMATLEHDRNEHPEHTFVGLFHDNTPGSYPDDICKYADEFLEDHQNIYELVFSEAINETTTKVKVAILDTGLDMGHHSIRARKERIKDVRTWVDGLGGKEDRRAGDSSGHGTYIANLLLDVAPDTDIYVARIAESSPIQPSEIAKAIDYAVDEWQVDIISMSFGFHDESDELSRAILNAHAHHVLMFAAASNNGAHGLAAFPARHHNVFCIYASDGMGNSIRGNPTPRQHDYNFCTLGEAVESAWPRALSQSPWKVRKSGTSFSTPVAAGLAAIVLLYAQSIMAPGDALKFRQYDKMRDMLHYMSTPRGGYNVLLSISNFFGGREKEEALQVKMKSIACGSPIRT